MTLLLSVTTPAFLVQLTGRLVTLDPGGTPVDFAANKTLIVYANDAIATVCYSRLARIDGVPTDHFIAEAMTGEKLDPAALMTFRISKGEWPDLGTMVVALQSALQSCVDRDAITPALVPEIVVAGWKWRPGRGKAVRNSIVKPVLWFLRYERGQLRFHRPQLDPVHPLFIAAVPTGSFTGSDVQRALAALPNGGDPESVRTPMVGFFHDYAMASGGRVGHDFMAVSLPRPPNGYSINVEFLPDPGAGDDRPGYPSLGAFGPWVIGPAKTVRPLEFVGITSVPLGPFTVTLRGPGSDVPPPPGPTMRTAR